MSRRIYMDHHATTPVDPRVVEAMLPYFTERPGNPSSPHEFGWEAAEAVDHARQQVAQLLGGDPKTGFDTRANPRLGIPQLSMTMRSQT